MRDGKSAAKAEKAEAVARIATDERRAFFILNFPLSGLVSGVSLRTPLLFLVVDDLTIAAHSRKRERNAQSIIKRHLECGADIFRNGCCKKDTHKKQVLC